MASDDPPGPQSAAPKQKGLKGTAQSTKSVRVSEKPTRKSDRSALMTNEFAGASLSPSAETLSISQPVPGFVLPADEARGGPLKTLLAAVYAIPRIEPGAIAEQMHLLGFRSLGFVCLVLGFVGGILVYQAGIQALRIVPDTSTIGPAYIEILVRDLAASLTALMLATRVGAGIAAEIGSMKVTDQLDALRLSNADPVVYLVAPRLVACVLVTPLLTIVGGAVALTTGALTGLWVFDINPVTFLDGRFVDGIDLGAGLVKSVAFGFAIPVMSAHAGLYTSGGSQGVGNATTRAVVGSSLAVIVLGFLIGALAETLSAGAGQ